LGNSASGSSATSTGESNSYDPGTLSGTDTYYLRARSLDNAGNYSDWWTVMSYEYDETAPSVVSSLQSTSHSLSTWTNDATIDIDWVSATDANGVSGHYYLLDTATNTAINGDETFLAAPTVAFSNYSLAEGNAHYVHVAGIDVANNIGSTIHLGPFI